MKKILSLAVALIASVSMFAQPEAGTFNVTPKVGINVVDLTHYENAKTKVDLVAGAEVSYQTTEKSAISAGVLYSAQGCKLGAGKVNLGYLSIPLLANYYVTKGLAIKAGVEPAILLSAKAKAGDFENDIKEDMNKFDLSVPVGVSYEISNVVIDARYHVGVLNIFKEDTHDTKNSVIQFTLGYKF